MKAVKIETSKLLPRVFRIFEKTSEKTNFGGSRAPEKPSRLKTIDWTQLRGVREP